MNIFKWLFRKKEKSTPQFSSVPEKSSQPYIQQINNQNQSIVHKFDAGIIPFKVDNIPIAYRRFKTNIISQNTLIYEKMQKSGDFSILAEEKNGKILLYYYEEFYAIVNDEQTEAMIKDWIRNKEPFLIYANSSDTVYVAFYRDKRKKMADREHEVVKLTAFSSNAKQETISFLEDGEELNIEEDYDNNGNDIVIVMGQGDEIGRLPKKQANRIISEGFAGCFLNHIEIDVEKDKYIPFVDIYW